MEATPAALSTRRTNPPLVNPYPKPTLDLQELLLEEQKGHHLDEELWLQLQLPLQRRGLAEVELLDGAVHGGAQVGTATGLGEVR